MRSPIELVFHTPKSLSEQVILLHGQLPQGIIRGIQRQSSGLGRLQPPKDLASFLPCSIYSPNHVPYRHHDELLGIRCFAKAANKASYTPASEVGKL